ncbi:MAG: prephenate dehydratase [Acidimicrobiales bacterium]
MITNPVSPTDRVGYLGPAGTFSEQALLGQPDLAAARRVPFDSFADLLFAVDCGDLEYGFVATENAIEGSVNITMDTLAFDVELLIQREVVLPVEMNLMVRPGTGLDQIKQVASFPHAYAQCRDWLRENLPGAELVPTTSTAGAAEAVALGDDPSVAAIGNSRAAEVYGLDLVARDIEDHPENATRFALVARSGIPAPTGHDKTSMVVFQRADTPGSLLGILQEFAARRINLSLLLSRPTKTALGDYCFLIDADGHIADDVVADCLRALKVKQDVKFLGSYPADGARAPEVRGDADAKAVAAEDWLASLRAQLGDPSGH